MSDMKCKYCEHPSYDRHSAYVAHLQTCKGKVIYELKEQIKELDSFRSKYEDIKERYDNNMYVLDEQEHIIHNMNVDINKLEDENRRLREMQNNPSQSVYIYNDNRVIIPFVEKITPMLKECVKYAITNGIDPMQQATHLLQQIKHPLAVAIINGKQDAEVLQIKSQLEEVVRMTVEEVN
jgi:hypothetical protein